MTFFDMFILALFLLLTYRGVRKGLISQTTFIVAQVSAFGLAARFYGDVSRQMLPFLSPRIGFFLSFALLFLLVYLAISLAGKTLKKGVNIVLLGWLDKGLGGLFGAVKGYVLALILFFILSGIPGNDFLHKSKSYPVLYGSTKLFLSLVKDPNIRDSLITIPKVHR